MRQLAGHTSDCISAAESLIINTCLIFVDDGCVYSKEERDHIDDLSKVFKRLVANRITLKASKCSWATDNLALLGHVVEAGKGVKADPDKIKAVMAMKALSTSAEVKSFLGMTGYLQKFIPFYAEYAEPLRKLAAKYNTKNPVDISEEWEGDPQYKQAFETLKVAIGQAALLRFPDHTAPWIILVDTSRKAMGATLCQLDENGVECPVEYASSNLSKCEKNYGISDLEGAGVCWAVRRWSHLIRGNVCILVTDHSALQCLVQPGKQFKNGRLARYAMELQEHDLVITHRSGATLHAPDLLSRIEMSTDEEEVEELMKLAFAKAPDVAMQLKGELKKKMLSPEIQQGRLKRAVSAAEVREAVKGKQVESVHDMVRLIKEGSRTVMSRQVEEQEEQSRVFDFYDMVCTTSWEGVMLADEETEDKRIICKQTIAAAQAQDLFCLTMRRLHEEAGKWLPEKGELRRKCVAWAPHTLLEEGVLYHRRTGGRKMPNSSEDIGLRMWIPNDNELKQQIVETVHAELAHPGIKRTYSAIGDRFYWPGMFRDTLEHCNNCLNCQFHAPKPAKAPIQGHVQADSPGEMAAMDILHMSESEGYKYLLTVVDVYSRYGKAIPLKNISARTVSEAVRDHVSPCGFGRPPRWLTDGGSEFKAEMAEALEAWDAKAIKSAADHPQSHGIIERYNRQVINNVAKLLKESKQAEWTNVIAAACEAGNCAVSRSLSEGGEMVAPSELWYGRNTILDGFLRVTSTKKLAHAYARGLKEQLTAIKEIVMQSRERYQGRMRADDRNKDNTVRKLKEGQEVSLYRPTKSKKMDKLSELMRGPYKVMQVMPSGVDYRIRLRGSSNRKDDQIRHIDEIRLLRRFNSVEMSAQTHMPASKQVAKKTAKQYEVKHISGERTDAAQETQYLIKWKGYGEHTWEPEGNLDCPLQIKEWIEMTPAQRKSRFRAAERAGIAEDMEEVLAAESSREIADAITESNLIKMDLSKLPRKQMLKLVAAAAGIELDEIAAWLGGPPCETYSPADATNISRGNNYRDHDDLEKGPRRNIYNAADRMKAEIARRHDSMIKNLTESLVQEKEEHDFEIVLENPVGSLRKRPFMQTVAWVGAVTMHAVHYCAFGGDFYKPTNIWTTLDWEPKGNTGNGKCACIKEHDKEKHEYVIGGPMDRRMPGPAYKQKVWAMPRALREELMDAIRLKQPGKKYVIDLFAGGESWRSTVEAAGYTYIPVDIRAGLARALDGASAVATC